MVYIAGGKSKDFEKVKVDEWITGVIQEVQEFKDVEKTFLNKEFDEENGEYHEVKTTKLINQVRFKFKLDGYEFSHYSKKMTASLNERSNLFLFLSQLYGELLSPDIPVELDMLKGVKVKTMWVEIKLKDGGIFQYPDKIRSMQDTLPPIWNVKEKEPKGASYTTEDGDEIPSDNVPF